MNSLRIPNLKEGLEAKLYVLAFLDLMGQRSFLDKIANEDDPQKSMAGFKGIARNTLGGVYHFRSLLKQTFDGYISASLHPDIQRLPIEQQNAMKDHRNIDVRFQGFADTVLVYFPLTNDEGQFRLNAIYALLAACGAVVPTLHVGQFMLRGGIAIAPAVEILDGEIYGPALSRAYGFESRIAKYPRIVVDDRLVNILSQTLNENDEGTQGQINSIDAQVSLDWIKRDSDDRHVVNYLGSGAQNIAKNVPAWHDVVGAAYQQITKLKIKFAQKGNVKLLGYYSALANFYENSGLDFVVNDKDKDKGTS